RGKIPTMPRVLCRLRRLLRGISFCASFSLCVCVFLGYCSAPPTPPQAPTVAPRTREGCLKISTKTHTHTHSHTHTHTHIHTDTNTSPSNTHVPVCTIKRNNRHTSTSTEQHTDD